MQSTYNYYSYVNLPISGKARWKAGAKVLVATVVSIVQLWNMLPLFYSMFIQDQMVDPVALLAHAGIFGLTFGYVLRVTLDIFRGYVRTRWFDTLIVFG